MDSDAESDDSSYDQDSSVSQTPAELLKRFEIFCRHQMCWLAHDPDWVFFTEEEDCPQIDCQHEHPGCPKITRELSVDILSFGDHSCIDHRYVNNPMLTDPYALCTCIPTSMMYKHNEFCHNNNSCKLYVAHMKRIYHNLYHTLEFEKQLSITCKA
jgi:hypothetical protein